MSGANGIDAQHDDKQSNQNKATGTDAKQKRVGTTANGFYHGRGSSFDFTDARPVTMVVRTDHRPRCRMVWSTVAT